MSEQPQYDSLLGGAQDLPPSINLLNFTTARTSEIEAMKQSIAYPSTTKLAFQKLPKHMRRRVMAHNVKRLPRRLREIHLNQFRKAGMPPKPKRPSRKYRRRPKNLVQEYARRQHKHMWLETHLWHAKRFHMIEKWGYRLPYSPCDKAFRACYRASAKHCLIQDISYISCIEISGLVDLIVNGMKQICSSWNGLSVAAKAYFRGNREGETTIFEYNTNLKTPIGSVRFIWKPVVVDDANRTLWIWVHAAYYKCVFDNLQACFKSFDVKLCDLRDELNRFRLTGPLSQSILQKCFKLPDFSNSVDWFQTYLENGDCRQAFSDQFNYWKSLENTSPAEISPHIVFALIVTDPRYSWPKKRMKAEPEYSLASESLREVPETLPKSPIWDREVRCKVKGSKISNEQITKLRQQLLVPGTDLEQPGVPVPVILIHQPGKDGYCSGWDVIVPSGWAQPTWIALNMWGGRAGGLREVDSMSFEMGRTLFFKPDTKTGVEEEIKTTEGERERYFRLPPNKRINYAKYSIASPFAFSWKLLISEWITVKPVDEFNVIRDKNTLQFLQNVLNHNAALKDFDCNKNLLAPVRLKLIDKGNVQRFSVICQPKKGDFKSAPVEPKTNDENREKRKELRKAHKDLLKRLKKRRQRGRENGKVVPIDTKMLLEYKNKMRQLWLPEPTSIRKSCSRDVIGFVTKGGFSYSLGQSAAVGYITIGCLPHLLSGSGQFKNTVLIRNTSSRQYRLATFEVINGNIYN